MTTTLLAFRPWLVASAVSLFLGVPASHAAPLTLPGTGLTLDVPPTLHLAPFGPYLQTDDATLVVAVTSVPKVPTPDMIEFSAHRYPHEASPSFGDLHGELRERNRSLDQGSFDAWLLRVRRPARTLEIATVERGDDPKVHEVARRLMEHPRWDETEADAEASMGVRATVPGMHLDRANIGMLAFAPDPGLAAAGSRFYSVTVLPVPKGADSRYYPRGCVESFQRLAAKSPVDGPHQGRGTGLEYCEGWQRQGSDLQYFAYVHSLAGGLLTVIGSSSDDPKGEALAAFRQATAHLQLLRTPDGSARR